MSDIAPDVSPVEEKRTPPILRAILFLLIAGLVILFLTTAHNVMKDIPSKHAGILKKHDPEGRIFLTLAPEASAAQNVYEFTLSDRVLRQFIEGFDFEGHVRAGGDVSADGNSITYFVADRGNFADPRIPFASSPFQLLTFPLSDPNDWHIWTAASSTMWNRSNPRWSPDGNSITFEGFPTANADRMDLEDPYSREIYIVNRDEGEGHIISGSYPQWLPNGAGILYLGPDGLYLRDLEATHESSRILSMQDGRTRADYFDISPASNSLVLSVDGELFFYDVESWDALAATWRKDKVSESYYYKWPTFSPDGAYVATIRHDRGADQEEFGPGALVVIHIETGEETELVTLEDFNPWYHFISDWR